MLFTAQDPLAMGVSRVVKLPRPGSLSHTPQSGAASYLEAGEAPFFFAQGYHIV